MKCTWGSCSEEATTEKHRARLGVFAHLCDAHSESYEDACRTLDAREGLIAVMCARGYTPGAEPTEGRKSARVYLHPRCAKAPSLVTDLLQSHGYDINTLRTSIPSKTGACELMRFVSEAGALQTCDRFDGVQVQF